MTAIPLNKYISCRNIPLGRKCQVMCLLLPGQGFWKTAVLQLQRVQYVAEHQPDGGDHTPHLHHTLFGAASPFSSFFLHGLSFLSDCKKRTPSFEGASNELFLLCQLTEQCQKLLLCFQKAFKFVLGAGF